MRHPSPPFPGVVLEAELVADGPWRRWRAARTGLPLDAYRADAPADAAIALRYARLAALLPALRHPHLVPCLGAAVDAGGGRWLLLPIPAGPSLAERLAAGGPLPAPAAVGLVRALADALAGLHARGIVHRGIGADRIELLRQSAAADDDRFPFAPRLGGLGMAADPGERMGDDPRLDIRALGSLLCTCLLGRPGGVPDLVAAGHPPAVAALAADLLQPDTQRPVDGSGVRAACDEVLSGPVGARPAAAWIAVAAALAAALAAIAWSRFG